MLTVKNDPRIRGPSLEKSAEFTKEKIIKELVRDIISPFEIVRQLAQNTLGKVAEVLGTNVSFIVKETVEKHKDVLAIVPFKSPSKTFMQHKGMIYKIRNLKVIF